MRIWVTKYALTRGIYQAEVEPRANGCVSGDMGYFRIFLNPGEWTETELEAKAQEKDMIQRKIKSLRKQIEKLEGRL